MIKKALVAACGICCSTCRFFKENCQCYTGTDKKEVERKLSTQKKNLGQVCPILECAFKKKIAYCSRDCDKFPCEQYKGRWGCYPYSQGFLEMVKKRSKK